MHILAFDSAAAACSATRLRDGETVAHEWRAMTRGHAEALVPMIERVMQGAAYDALDAIGVTVGPGAYTGLRIGLATARGLSLATDVPVIGVSSFAVAAHQVAGALPPESDLLVVALETKRADLYLQAFAISGEAASEPASVAVDGLASWLPEDARHIAVAGDAADRFIAAHAGAADAVIADGAALPDAAAVAVLAAERLAGDPAARLSLRPMYLRPPDATLPPAVRRGRA